MINGGVGVGKLVAATVLAGGRKQWANVPFAVFMFLVTSLATIMFGSTTVYTVLITAAFLFGLGNVATNIGNATLSMMNAPNEIIGRLMASRGVFISAITIIGMVVFGRLADEPGFGPPLALWALGTTSAVGVLLVWFAAGRQLNVSPPAEAPGGSDD
jgi:MFS family permease